MASRDIIISLPNTHLHNKSERVGVITSQVRQIIEEMKGATLDWEATRPHEVGVALAAIQIDKPLKIVVIRNNFDDKDDKSFSVFINPEITKLEGEIEEDYEGCLSVQDVYGKVPRYNKVRIRALDENGQQIRIKADGFLARVLQHEIDHINGITFVDHIKDNQGAFYQLTEDGKLVKLDYDKVKTTGILR
jgi:peptide deformylase